MWHYAAGIEARVRTIRTIVFRMNFACGKLHAWISLIFTFAYAKKIFRLQV